jgi:glycerol-1-phosphate dehydrogenase [NAD(P)+]
MIEEKRFSSFSIPEMLEQGGYPCPCGRRHGTRVRNVVAECGVLERLPDLLRERGAVRPFILEDANTAAAAGGRVAALLERAGIKPVRFAFPQASVEPDEASVGQAIFAFDRSCDFIVAVGTGTLNDIGKILARTAGLPLAIVATAPSMDGFASATSSMISNGLKVTIDSACPELVLADLDILSAAPERLLKAGLGDMLAKYVSICDWRIARIVTGEYYCEEIADLIRRSLAKCAGSAAGLFRREPGAAAAVFEGLVLSGMAMGFAGVSRPASGVEHYISHIWDMRSLALGAAGDLHGIQVGIGTVMALRAYDMLRNIRPDREKALAAAAAFRYGDWERVLRANLGAGAEGLVRNEAREGKYGAEAHAARLERIIAHWPEILAVIDEELPPAGEVERLMRSFGLPVSPAEIGIGGDEARFAFLASKDIRDKYVATRLLWDLGILEEVAAALPL